MGNVIIPAAGLRQDEQIEIEGTLVTMAYHGGERRASPIYFYLFYLNK